MASIQLTDSEQRQVLLETVAQLAPLVEAGLSRKTPTAFAFACATGETDDFEPSDERLKTAIASFDSLLPHQQKNVCNGWNPGDITSRPSTRELLADLSAIFQGEDITSIMEVSGKSACREWHFTSDTTPVKVLIRFGTSKATALAELRKIEAAVLNYYAEMIADPGYTDFDHLGKMHTRDATREAIGAMKSVV